MYMPGDKITIRKDLVVGEVYGYCTYLENMARDLQTKYVTIIGVSELFGEVIGYSLDNDWFITAEFIEGLYSDDTYNTQELTPQDVIDVIRAKIMELDMVDKASVSEVLDEVENKYM